MLKNLSFLLFVLLSYSAYAQTDPNNDPNWDWRASTTFTVYPQALGYVVNTTSPFYQGGISEAVFDNKPEDGWVLVKRDFGMSGRNAPVPYFALYNKYEGILRVFPYVVMNGAYTKGFINIYWGTDIRTAALTFLNNTAWGVHTIDSTKNNASAAYTPVINANWAFADFPLAYEYNVSSFTNPSFHFEIWGSTISNVSLTIQGDILQHFGSNQAANLPNPGFFQTGGTFDLAQKHVQGTQSTWTGWKTVIDNIGKQIDSNSTSSSLINLKNAIKSLSNSWTVSNLGAIGAAVGLLDFFITGGRLTNKEQPAPMNFKANFTATGTINTDVRVSGGITLPLPGSNITNNTTPTNLLYNDPLGILNLRETPIVEHRKYDQPVGTNITRETHSFRIKNDLIIDLNPSSDLELTDIKAALIYVPKTKPMAQEFLGYADQGYSNIDSTPIELESATDSVFEFRTPYVNAYTVKYQKITIPLESLSYGFNVQGGEWIPFYMPINTVLGKLYLKIHATLKVKNSTSDRQPVVFVAKYNVMNQEGDGLNAYWPVPPQPAIINVTENYEYDGTYQEPPQYGFVGEQKQIAVQDQIIKNNKMYCFYEWNDGNTSSTRYVNPTVNTNLTAYYKAHLYSTTPTATAPNNQRKIVQSSNGYWAMVYVSMDQVWLSRSTDGVNWEKEIWISDYVNGDINVCPSIDIYNDQAYIVWQSIYWVGISGWNTAYINVRRYDLSNNTLGSTITVASFEPPTESFISSPVIAYSGGKSNSIALAWREPDAIKIIYGIGMLGNDNLTWGNTFVVPGSNSNSYNPSIAYASGNDHALCWEQYNSEYKKINYITAIPDYKSDWTFSNSAVISPYYWENNTSPQITVVDRYKPTIVWTSRNNIVEGRSSVHIRQRSGLGANDTWGNITTFSPSSSEYTYPVVGNYSQSNKMEILWNIGNYIYKASYNGSAWSSPTIISTSGGSGVNINRNSAWNTYQTKALWKKPDNTIVFQNIGGTAPPAKVTAGEENEITTLLYRLNRHAIIELPKDIDSTAKGSVCFEIAGISTLYNNSEKKINYSLDENNLLASEPFRVAAENIQLKFSGAIYGAGLDLKNDFISSITEPLAKVMLKDKKSNETLKDIWVNDPSMLNQIKNGTFGEFRDIFLDLNNYLGKTVYVQVEMIGESKNIKPLIVDDYLILKDSTSIAENLAKKNYTDYALPTEYTLMQNFPNPFNPNTTITFFLPEAQYTTLKIYNVLGKEVKTVVNENLKEGYHSVDINMSNEPSGVYLYSLSAGNFRETKKLLLLK